MSIDYTTLPDAELEQIRAAAANEQDRRLIRSRNPGEIRRLTEQFLASGGDPAALAPATTEGVPVGDQPES